MMLLACMFCRGPMTPTTSTEFVLIKDTAAADNSAATASNATQVHIRGYICKFCGWYTEINDSHIMNRDGTYGFKDTGD